jgi:hypothetical protein
MEILDEQDCRSLPGQLTEEPDPRVVEALSGDQRMKLLVGPGPGSGPGTVSPRAPPRLRRIAFTDPKCSFSTSANGQ